VKGVSSKLDNKPKKTLPAEYVTSEVFVQTRGIARRDRSRGVGYIARENGRFGSHAMHDGFDDESGPE
jgi:hypothetical protein